MIISAEEIFIKESREKYFGKRESTLIGYDILIDNNIKSCWKRKWIIMGKLQTLEWMIINSNEYF